MRFKLIFELVTNFRVLYFSNDLIRHLVLFYEETLKSLPKVRNPVLTMPQYLKEEMEVMGLETLIEIFKIL